MVKSLVVQMERDLPAEKTMANPYINPFAENDLAVNPGGTVPIHRNVPIFGADRKF